MLSKHTEAICERVHLVRTVNNITRKDLNDTMRKHKDYDYSEHYIKGVETKRHGPSFEYLIVLRSLFNLRWEWLMEGKGSMVE